MNKGKHVRVIKTAGLVFMAAAVCTAARAQGDYAVTAKGDTLRGEIQILTYDLQDRLQIVSDKKKQHYTCLQVPTVFIDSVVYRAQRHENGYRYMNLIKGGFLSLYGFRLKGQFGYDGRMLIRLDGKSMELPNIGFKKQMSDFLADCEALALQIKNSELGRKDLDEIIDTYNDCSKPGSATAATVSAAGERVLAALENLSAKARTSAIANQKDLDDLLTDLSLKIKGNQKIPNYQIAALKEYLAGHTAAQAELTAFLDALAKN
jgi:hypothetical protein